MHRNHATELYKDMIFVFTETNFIKGCMKMCNFRAVER